jgi:hypothetical protein
VETVGPILHRHGLVWMTLPGRDDRGEPALTYRLAHAPTGEVVEGQNLNAAAMDGLFKRVEFERTEGEKVNDAINRLTASQASGLIDTISQGAIKTGGTDVPSSPDEFRHAPAGPDPVLA